MSEESSRPATTAERLPPSVIEIVEQATLAVVATADAHGECDSSLRAGPPGFLRVLDPARIAYPEYRGNGVMASLGNLEENPHIGLLVVDLSGGHPNLHLGGPAVVVPDAEMRAEHPDLPLDAVPGRRTDTWVVIHVEDTATPDGEPVPRLMPLPRDRPWGTDSPVPKGGDYFGAAARRRAPAARTAATETAGASAVPTSDTPTPSDTPPGVGPTAEESPAGTAAPDADASSGTASEADASSPTTSSGTASEPDGASGTAPTAPSRSGDDVDVPRPRSGAEGSGRGPAARHPSTADRARGLLVATAVLAVLVVLLTTGLVVALVGSSDGPSSTAAADDPTGPTGPPTLYGRVVDIPDPATVVVDVAGQPVTVSVLGLDAATIPPCALPGASAFARRTLDRQMVTVVPDPTVAESGTRRGYVVTASQSSYSDAAILAGWAVPAGTALYRPVFDEESRTARAEEVGMFGPACTR